MTSSMAGSVKVEQSESLAMQTGTSLPYYVPQAGECDVFAHCFHLLKSRCTEWDVRSYLPESDR